MTNNSFEEDIRLYLEGKTSKKEFIENVTKNIEESNYSEKQTGNAFRQLAGTEKGWLSGINYSEERQLFEALDEIVYTKEKPENLQEDQVGSLLFEEYYARPSKAALAAATVMSFIADRNNTVPLRFYEEKNRSISDYALQVENMLQKSEIRPQGLGFSFHAALANETSLIACHYKESSNELDSLNKLYSAYELSKHWGLRYERECKASRLMNSKIESSKMKVLRAIAKDNVSDKKGEIKPKRSAQEKKNIKLVLDSISKGIND